MTKLPTIPVLTARRFMLLETAVTRVVEGLLAGTRGEMGKLSIAWPLSVGASTWQLRMLLEAIGVGSVIVSIYLVTMMDVLARLKWIQKDRLAYYRSHWTGYLAHAVLRTIFIAFFSMTTLALLQFALHGPAGPTAIAAVVFTVFLVGMGGLVIYACHFRLRYGKFASSPDRILLRPAKILRVVPWVVPVRLSQLKDQDSTAKPVGSLPWIHFHFVDNDIGRKTVHQDEPYLKRFGWLSARYRRSRWWFFAFWLGHQFVRACFIGGAAGNPLAQVFGLFIYDFFGLVIIAKLNPYEGQRNTALAVWLLGMAKFATTGLSIAFLPDFNINRIVATVLGVIIIVIQAILVMALMVLVVIGGISSWMSLSRNQEEFSSHNLEGIRIKYFEHLIAKAPDDETQTAPERTKSRKLQKGKSADTERILDLPRQPSFSVNSVRRAPKIEDEDVDAITEMDPASVGFAPIRPGRNTRTNSVSSRHSVSSLPRGARVHRTSWSSKDFSQWHAEMERPSTASANRGVNQSASPLDSKSTAVYAQAPVTSLRNFTPAQSRPMTPTLEQEEKADGESIDEKKGIRNNDDQDITNPMNHESR